MENITFYDFVTFVIDFVGVRFLFWNPFHNFLKHRKKIWLLWLSMGLFIT